MLNENIKRIRRSKGFSQEQLAVRLNVARQTVSKWERGLSVPDCDMLISLSKALETPVSVLLGETFDEPEADGLKVISERLDAINNQLALRELARRKIFHWLFILICVAIAIIFAVLIMSGSAYLDWDFSDPETAVAGTFLHGSEWLFVRLAPIIFIGAIAGAVLTREKQ